MAYCTSCGAEIRDDDAFCSECGAEVGDGETPRQTLEQEDREPAGDHTHTTTEADQDLSESREATGGSTGSTNWDFDKDSDDVEQGPEKDGVDFGHLFIAGLIGIVPAFVAYAMATIAANTTLVVVFFLAIPVFTYLLYQRPTAKAMVGGAAFWLAIEAFLSPLALGIYTVVFASQETTTGAEQAGAAIGGVFLVGVAFVIGVPLGIVLYLLSKRLDPDDPEAAS